MSKLRTAITWAVTTAMVASSAGIALSASAGAATTVLTARVNVYVRSGPSTSKAILRTLQKGEFVRSAGKVSGDWQPITFNGTTAYVFADYVKTAKKATTPVIAGPAGKKNTTVNVNVRTKADLKSDIVKVLKKGTTVAVTGRASGAFSEVKVDGTIRWMYTAYLSTTSTSDTTPDPTPTPTPAVAGTFITTSLLAMRTAATPNSATLGDLKANTTVGLTGKHEGSYSQILHKGKVAWILSGYLKPTAQSGNISLPTSKGLLYINASDVNVRTDATADSGRVATLPKATVLQSTGTSRNKFTQVIYAGKLAWVASEYLSTTKPGESLGSSSLDKLKPTAKAFVPVIRENFPEIKTIYGWRASSAYSSDHPNGRAIDIMIPSYKKNKALGDEIAEFVIDNAKKYKVKYIIWRQRNYTISRGKWVKMADRGSDTQNHYDHVHVSFLS